MRHDKAVFKSTIRDSISTQCVGVEYRMQQYYAPIDKVKDVDGAGSVEPSFLGRNGLNRAKVLRTKV